MVAWLLQFAAYLFPPQLLFRLHLAARIKLHILFFSLWPQKDVCAVFLMAPFLSEEIKKAEVESFKSQLKS